MAKRNYGILPFFLSLIAIPISTLAFLLPPFLRAGVISIDRFQLICGSPVHFSLWGWLLGFVLAIVSLYMISGTRDILRKVIPWIFSLLAITGSLMWANIALSEH